MINSLLNIDNITYIDFSIYLKHIAKYIYICKEWNYHFFLIKKGQNNNIWVYQFILRYTQRLKSWNLLEYILEVLSYVFKKVKSSANTWLEEYRYRSIFHRFMFLKMPHIPTDEWLRTCFISSSSSFAALPEIVNKVCV